MCTTQKLTPPTATPTPATNSLDERIVAAAIGGLELFGVFLGKSLGLYEALHAIQPATPRELADRASIDQRYAREWLEQQAVAGYLSVDHSTEDEDARCFSVPSAHLGVLIDPQDGSHVAPLAHMLVGVANVLDEVVAAYRTGDGVAYEKYGAHFRHGQGGINRPAFENDLIDSWLPAVAGASDALLAGGSLADVGCGQGYSTVAMARHWPTADIVGVDTDSASIADAREFAQEQGVAARFVAFEGAGLSELGTFDVVTMLECLHDMAHPVEALASARAALAGNGVLVLADELVADTFVAPGDDLERFMYGWSISHCLPASRAEEGSAGLGTVLRAGTVEELALEAGFGSVEVIDVDGGFFRIYAIRP